MIQTMATTHATAELCRTVGVSRSGYYAWRRGGRGNRAKANRTLGELIKQIHQQSRGVYGSPRVTRDLHAQAVPCGHNRVARIMRDKGLRGVQKGRFRPKTTDSKHRLPISPNRLVDLGNISHPNQAWGSDITYIPVREGWLYLSVVMDLGTRTIKGWALRESLKTDLVVSALHQAAFRYKPPPGLIVHSDRGSQYASHEFQHQLLQLKALGSMGRTGCCYDNATMESFWSTLKTELHIKQPFNSKEEARLAIFDYIETFYNPKRRHSSIGYLPPLEFEAHLMARTFDPYLSEFSG